MNTPHPKADQMKKLKVDGEMGCVLIIFAIAVMLVLVTVALYLVPFNVHRP